MPNYDAGHYFLTMLAPVRIDTTKEALKYSYRQTLLDTLAKLPNSQVGATTRDDEADSPFARSTMTHLARFVLIDGPPYNGRQSGDTLLAKVQGLDPMVQQPVDSFPMPYLLFAADFDAQDGSDASLRKFTDDLWTKMQVELRSIFNQCYGFDDNTIRTADDFFRYVKACQVETTMPFNDYWRPADLEKMPKDLALPVGALNAVAKARTPILLALGLWLACCLFAALGQDSVARDAAAWVARWGTVVVLAVLAGIGGYLLWLYNAFRRKGQVPFPPGAQLPDVLKSLYLQQRFLEFVVAHQGASPADLYAAFGRFVLEQRLQDESGPTQPPGVIRTPPKEPEDGDRTAIAAPAPASVTSAITEGAVA